ncbi:MAG: hypothetical protein Tsb0021_16450 [Chlamydiales bacterium]
MATIDNLDIGVYFQYARRTEMLEKINRELHLSEASAIPKHTQLLDIYPKLTELDLLLGVARTYAPWAFFYPPKRFRNQRRSPFKFSRVAPAFGDDEQQEEDMDFLQSLSCESKSEEEERGAILDALKQIGQINDWLGTIVGRIGQFLQG